MWVEKTFSELGYTYTGLSGKTKADFGSGAPYIPYMNVFSNEKIDVGAFEYVRIGKNECQNAVKVGDALFTTSSETPEEVGMSSVLTEDVDTVYLNSFCFGLRFYKPSDFVPNFLAYALRSSRIRHQMFIAAQGSTRHNLSKENFNKMILYYPASLSEQRRIAEILTSADAAIAAGRALVGKYEAVKAGVMRDLLGNGESVRLGEIVCTSSGGTPSRQISAYFDGTVPWVTTSELNDTLIFETLEHISEAGLRNSSAKLFPKGTLLIAMYGATIGKLGILEIEAATNQACCALLRSEKIDTTFLYYTLLSMRKDLINLGSGAGQPNISQAIIRKLRIYLPPLSEQKHIAAILTSADARIASARAHLKKLEGVKSGLMSDLLTNRVSVDEI